MIRKRSLPLDEATPPAAVAGAQDVSAEELLQLVAAALATDPARRGRERAEGRSTPVILARAQGGEGVVYFFGRVDTAGRRALSRREVDIALRMTRDKSVKEILGELRLGEGTVKTFQQRIQRKTGLRGRALALFTFHVYFPCATEETTPSGSQPKTSAQNRSPRSQPKIPAQDPSPRSQPKIPAQAIPPLRSRRGRLSADGVACNSSVEDATRVA